MHNPSCVDPAASVPCFVNTPVSSEPMLSGANPFNCWDNCPAGTAGTIWRHYCYTDAEWTPANQLRQRVQQCLSPRRPNAGARVAFLIGDSHAASIKVGVERAVEGIMSLSFIAITGGTCGLVYSATDGICLDAYNIIRERLTTNVRNGDIVIVSHAGYKYWDASTQGQQRDLLRDVYQNILQPRGAKLVIMGDPPVLPRWAVYCLQNVQNCYTSTANTDQNAMLAPLANEFSGVIYLPIHHLFCNSQNCMAQVPGTPTFAFFDTSHLTTAGALYLWPYICSALGAAGFL